MPPTTILRRLRLTFYFQVFSGAVCQKKVCEFLTNNRGPKGGSWMSLKTLENARLWPAVMTRLWRAWRKDLTKRRKHETVC